MSRATHKFSRIARQSYVATGIIIQNLATGVVLGLPAILTPAITSNSTDTDVHVSREEASWITAAQGITGPIGYLIIPSLMQILGRRFINVIANLLLLIGTVTIALATDFTALIAGRSTQGLSYCHLFISSLLIAEYGHPKTRGLYTVLKASSIMVGLLLFHGLNIILPWRQIVWLSTVPSILGVISTLTWPESPSWLAYKERYDECTKSFEWLRGKGLESQTELKELITAQREIRKLETSINSFARFVNAFRSKAFLKPLFIAINLSFIIHSCGLYYLLAYTIEIVTQLTGDKSKSLYYTMGVDVIKLLGIMSSLIWIQMFPRRTLLFLGGSISCVVLALTCILDYLNKNGFLNYPWLSFISLSVYGFVMNAGILSTSTVIKGEIFPIEFKGIGTTACGIGNSLIGATVLKLTSNMLEYLDTYGTFAVYLLMMALFLIIVYFVLPETKDRTLQDIENEFLDLAINNDDVNDMETKTILEKQ